MNWLWILLGVGLGISIVVGFLLWFWLRNKIKTIVETLIKTVQGLQSAVPPFRIHLTRLTQADWRQPQVIQSVTSALETLGYRPIADYQIPEIEDTYLRALWHPQDQTYGVVYDHPQVGVFADLAQDLQDGIHLTVSCAPESGMSQPEFVQMIRLALDLNTDPDAIHQLHQALGHARGAQIPQPLTAEMFEERFTQAYAREMDWRIQRGGITAAEVRQVALVGGMEEPSPTEIEQVRMIWKAGIVTFIEEQALESFLQTTTLSAAQWEAQRDRVRVIHEQLSKSDLIEELTEHLVGEIADESAEEAAYQQARQHLQPAFSAPLVRQGFRAAQQVLPESQRFTLIGSVAEPFAADLYLQPLEDEID